MAKVSSKKNLSSMQVIKTLQVLLEGNYTMNELVQKLNKDEKGRLFNNSVISKYINTCRCCGIDIPKIHNKYFVASMPFGLELSFSEIALLENLQNIVKLDMTSKYHKLIDKFVDKINQYSNKKIGRVEAETSQQTADFFESAIAEKRKINLMFKNRMIMECIPLGIVQNKGKTFFNVFYKNKDRMVDADRVSGIEVLTKMYSQNWKEASVVYKLKGDLALRYTLRDNEQLSPISEPGCITISNRGESKEILFARLLRYDDKCEILTPKLYREEMKKLLNEALSNYGEV